MFERFTHDARATVLAARAHADRLGHRPVGAEHLLLGLLDTCPPMRDALDGIDVEAAVVARHDHLLDIDRQALASLGIDLDRVRAATDDAFGPGAFTRAARAPHERRRRRLRRPSRLFDADARTALELSLREAVRLGHPFIAPEHVGLGLLRVGGPDRDPVAGLLAPRRDDLRARLEHAAGQRAADQRS